MGWLDRQLAELLVPLAMWVLASGLDDCFLDLAYIHLWFRARRRAAGANAPDPPDLERSAELAIAILIPCWQEAGVIEQMLDSNLTAIEYQNYDVWLGVYPNDQPTIDRVASCEAKFSRVRHIVCPHDGPTTKADCLNWLYHGVRAFEIQAGRRYELFVQHDAEDMIHPESLRLVARESSRFGMMQVPVFALATPLRLLTHGVYADEFAEFHCKDLYVRGELGGFIPSAGVGTAYRREVLDRLQGHNGDHVFDPDSLTEDYFIGLRIHRLGFPQKLLKVRAKRPFGPGSAKPAGGPAKLLATRAYFPLRLRAAIRQRKRWVMGNALQSWARFGWNAGPGQWYWLWRDRKGLLGSPVGAAANLLFCYGIARWLQAAWSGMPCDFMALIASQPLLPPLLWCGLIFLAWRQLARAVCVYQVYGWSQALTVPLRAPWANLINCCATMRALATFTAARVRRRSLTWGKTIHDYPQAGSPAATKRKLGEILVAMQLLSRSELDGALARQKSDERLGHFLIRSTLVPEEKIYQALSLQQGVPYRELSWEDLQAEAVEMIPALVAARWQILPFRVEPGGGLSVASPEAPDRAVERVLSIHSPLPARFHLITPSNYQWLSARFALARRREEGMDPEACEQLQFQFSAYEADASKRGSAAGVPKEAAEAPAGKRRPVDCKQPLESASVRLRRPRRARMRIRVPAWTALHRRIAVVVEYRKSI